MKIIKYDSYRDGGTQVFTCDNGNSYVINHAIGDESNHGQVSVRTKDGIRNAAIDEVDNLVFSIETMGSIDFERDSHDMRHYLFYGRVSAINNMSKFYGEKLNHVCYRLERKNGYFLVCHECSNILLPDGDVESIPLDTRFDIECECGAVGSYERSSRSSVNYKPSIRRIKYENMD